MLLKMHIPDKYKSGVYEINQHIIVLSLIYRHDDREMIKMKHMTINGIGGKVHYWISRPNNNSKGALVFTHGLTANHTMYVDFN